jgi:hypothetical protein
VITGHQDVGFAGQGSSKNPTIVRVIGGGRRVTNLGLLAQERDYLVRPGSRQS